MKIVNITLLSVLAIAFSCQESSVKSTHSAEEQKFDRTIGQRIPYETAMRWIGNQKSSTASSRESGLTISTAHLSNLLADGADGIALHYGVDANQELHILLLPIESQLLWTSNTRVVDANTNAVMDTETAHQWANSFKSAHADHVQFHAFGADVFADILNYSQLTIRQGINDDNIPQLLLFINPADFTVARTRTEQDQDLVYDKSNPCPPCDVISN